MRITIYKYPLPINDRVTIPMPQHAQVLSVHVQNEVPCIWTLVNPQLPIEQREFRIYGTGHAVEDSDLGKFVGTFLIRGGSLVFHVFEARR